MIGMDELSGVLERSRSALHAIDGVLAAGITRRDGELAIELVVRTDADEAAVRREASALVGDAPIVLTRSGEVVAGDG